MAAGAAITSLERQWWSLLVTAAWLACAGCAALEATVGRWQFLDRDYRDELLPLLRDSYERKLQLPGLPARPATPSPEGLDRG